MTFRALSRSGRSIGLAVALVVSSLVLVAVESPHSVSASTGCTSGSVSTTTEIGRNYLGETDESVSAPRVSSDRKLHRYTKVTFTSDGTNDASKTPDQILTYINSDTRISVNLTSFPTMWWGAPHIPNVALIKTAITNGFAYEDGNWIKFTGFTEDQYSAMGESYPNFSSSDEADIKIPIALLDIYQFSPLSAGDIVLSMYELYMGGGVTKSFTAAFIFDGVAFHPYENEIEVTVQFGHDGENWIPDNTIKYDLTSADVSFISNSSTFGPCPI